jgi:hypothetical protein
MSLRICTVHDPFRDAEFAINSLFLQAIPHAFALAAFRDSAFDVRGFESRTNGVSFETSAFRDLLGLPPIPEGWAVAACHEIPSKAEFLFQPLLESDFVVAFCMPPSLRQLLSRNGLRYLDLEIDPDIDLRIHAKHNWALVF